MLGLISILTGVMGCNEQVTDLFYEVPVTEQCMVSTNETNENFREEKVVELVNYVEPETKEVQNSFRGTMNKEINKFGQIIRVMINR